MYKQTEILFDQERGQQLAEVGMELAVDTANREHDKWSERCWSLFINWLRTKQRGHQFMVESFREYLYNYDLIERPQSDRAFGFISKRAVKAGLVTHAGIRKVTNAKAHSTPANVWEKA